MQGRPNEQRKSSSISAYGSTSMALIRDVKESDPEAWARLVRLYTPLIVYWCKQAGLSGPDTADVAQEVFRSLSTAIGGFRRDREGDTFRGWLRTVCRNKILDHLRHTSKTMHGGGGTAHQQRIAEIADDGTDGSVDGQSMPDEPMPFPAAIELVRSEFESRTWQAFWRTAVDGQLASDFAEELDMSHAAVRKAKSRVLKRLRQELASPVDDPTEG